MAKIRKMLSDWQKPAIQALMALIETQSKKTLATWAIDYSREVMLALWQKDFPNDSRPEESLRAARQWLDGEIKLPQAKPAILACHAAAKEAEEYPVARGAARAIGQSASTIHSARHCIGLAFYGALAVAYDELGITAPWDQLEQRAEEECWKMYRALQAIAVENEPNPAKIEWFC